MDKKYKYGKKRKCVICGVVFKPRDRDSKQKCCSYICRGKLQTRNSLKTCATCGKIFLPSIARYNNCSRKCGVVYRNKYRIKDPMTPVRKKMASFCCSCISRCLQNKTDHTRDLLGYSSEDLRKHLESKFRRGMSWKNYGNRKRTWSIDHIKPISVFPVTTSVMEINALSNLQPLWHSQNCAKKNHWEGQ